MPGTTRISRALRPAATPAEDSQPVYAVTVSSKTCLDTIGMSWHWAIRFCRAHGVPIWRIAERKQLIPVAPLMAAMARVAAQPEPPRELTEAEHEAALLARLGLRAVEGR